MRLQIDTTLFAFAEYLSADDCKAVLAAIAREKFDELTDAQRVAAAPIMAVIAAEHQKIDALHNVRSAAAKKSHLSRNTQAPPQPKPQPTPRPKETVDFGEYQPAWDRYTAYRRERRLSKLTPSTEKMWVVRIKRENISVEAFTAAVDLTIEKSWIGLFPDKAQTTQQQKQKPKVKEL